jgi:hypothetical protein
MINEFLIEKSDVVDTKDTTMQNTNDVVKEILDGVTNHYDLIKAIEKYNDDNKLPLNKRVKYSILVGAAYISVAKATEVGTETFLVTSYDYTGSASFEYDEKGKMTKGSASLSTHMIKAADVLDVVIKGYDKDVIDPIQGNKTLDEISESELIRKITDLDQNTFHYVTSGQYRSYIVAICNGFKKEHLNEYSYTMKPAAYNLYLKLITKYFNVLKEIVIDSCNATEKNSFAISVQMQRDGQPIQVQVMAQYSTGNKFTIVDLGMKTDEVYETFLKAYFDKKMNENDQFVFTDECKLELSQKIFTSEEIENYKRCLDWEHIKFDSNGNPYWTE